ncbi:hypothetical protein Dip510_001972 [Elusimicrobium posterum]|uniref:hypothetical protein n=1 Tax=Elusimicrobium posterum TaxID=3116653 RepID=UPI003C76D174
MKKIVLLLLPVLTLFCLFACADKQLPEAELYSENIQLYKRFFKIEDETARSLAMHKAAQIINDKTGEERKEFKEFQNNTEKYFLGKMVAGYTKYYLDNPAQLPKGSDGAPYVSLSEFNKQVSANSSRLAQMITDIAEFKEKYTLIEEKNNFDYDVRFYSEMIQKHNIDYDDIALLAEAWNGGEKLINKKLAAIKKNIETGKFTPLSEEENVQYLKNKDRISAIANPGLIDESVKETLTQKECLDLMSSDWANMISAGGDDVFNGMFKEVIRLREDKEFAKKLNAAVTAKYKTKKYYDLTAMEGYRLDGCKALYK